MAEKISFGTDGWRAVIGKGFNEENLIRVIDAATKAYAELQGADNAGKNAANTLIVGHDCRQDAHRYAELAAAVAAAHGFDVRLSRDYCPTPALCWTVAKDPQAAGGIILTSSHNTAEFLGVKLRMADGGASPKEFTDRVEELVEEAPTTGRAGFDVVDVVGPYLEELKSCIDADAIRAANLRVVIDPLFGAAGKHLAGLFEGLGAKTVEIHGEEDPSFGGLHPEPIEPWVEGCAAKVLGLSFDAGFATDGDADRIGAVDETGAFVDPHRIMALLVSHLVEDKGLTGRVVSTMTASELLKRQCRRLGLDLTITPVGFKWIHTEMQKGDVLIGGEESGGIGLPSHVMERDGLLMALLLAETMAQRKTGLKGLVDDMFAKIGRLEFRRGQVGLSPEQIKKAAGSTLPGFSPETFCGRRVISIDRSDGVKVYLEGESWVMMRPSGTEPVVRTYAEAKTMEEVEGLLAAAAEVVQS